MLDFLFDLWHHEDDSCSACRAYKDEVLNEDPPVDSQGLRFHANYANNPPCSSQASRPLARASKRSKPEDFIDKMIIYIAFPFALIQEYFGSQDD